jgi:hypothetical protein
MFLFFPPPADGMTRRETLAGQVAFSRYQSRLILPREIPLPNEGIEHRRRALSHWQDNLFFFFEYTEVKDTTTKNHSHETKYWNQEDCFSYWQHLRTSILKFDNITTEDGFALTSDQKHSLTLSLAKPEFPILRSRWYYRIEWVGST